jgi:membrane protein DedA with SNARE-associated domain
MGDWVTSMVEAAGYWGVLLLMFLENVFPPIPSELIMPLAGFHAARGDLTLWGVTAAGTAGSVVGALPLYYLGRAVGEERLKRWACRYGHWLAVSAEDLDRVKQWFDRRGNAAVFLCRLVPGIRSLVSIPAGVHRMALVPFLLYTTAGTAIWAGALAWVGSLLGQNYRRVEQWMGPVTYLVLGGIVVAFVVRAVRLKRKHRDSPECAPEAEAQVDPQSDPHPA